MYAAVKPRICLYVAIVLSEFFAKSRSWCSALPRLPRACKAANPASDNPLVWVSLPHTPADSADALPQLVN